ncbi:MAG: aminotransferase class I/II-fold pyridoxal phosphate-dependent enzyme [Gemmatimonadales bacterium]|jgi:1-aminocyclopropane-1-carboxylate synthase|nr:aminotransferase class I/II-fold pyridoxal phosphate-dependent enzyme [Gemmatimonadales bacterium]NCG32598.1 aminotransferase class I/II-fold pyridoxal phosphate-dependent enzyme [Pseudomonadota bacterium]MBT3774876.1 aminotransferase class I/II-fold pyridoxal phosphate-dependent enzyme [Gemmatimonadales bacterium]MBT3957726.1 aminotransferase class I/II-fold pyridoxal phosphate-dependent enzyme [Gemmatimonadales bacterium]MBT4189548.1 aminotransferase class I/II-fold pyridoxal phosphate-dep
MTTSSLSSRGALAANNPLRIDHAAYHEAVANAYHPTENPTGALPLNVAENRLSWSDLRAKIESITTEETIAAWVPGYTSMRGSLEFRRAAAHFLTRHLTRCPVDPEQLAVSAGATSVIEMTSFILADAGDAAAIPAPCYPVYSQDIGSFSGVERYDLVTHHEVSEISDGPALTVRHLEHARTEIETAGQRFRMLILTTPDNPTGGIYSLDTLSEVADWCIKHEVHLVVNELYGLSLIDTRHPEIEADYADDVTFNSFASIMADKQSEYLHLWYALSKDLGISGFRVGLLYSHNAALLEAYENLNLSHTVSNHTQWLLQHLLTDDDFMTSYVVENQRRLTEAYAVVVGALKRLDIPYVPSRGSLFVWIDLSEFMDGDSGQADLDLWQELYRTSGVLLTPGVGFGHTKKGMFRVVYPCVSMKELSVAMERLGAFVKAKRQRHGSSTNGDARS